MPNRSSNILVALVGCRHTPAFIMEAVPRPEEIIWCVRCGCYRQVSHIVGMYAARCNECKYARYFSAAKLNAQRAADSHARKYPGHVVLVTLGGDDVSEHGPHGAQQPPLPTMTLHGGVWSALDTPPF